jgi:tRNA A37 methylthiotransferase MiaB
MPDAIAEEKKARRLAIVMDRQREIQIARNNQLLGQTFEVLVDGASRRPASATARLPDGQSPLAQWSGRSSGNRILNFTSPRSGLLGQYIHVRVTGAAPNSLVGEQVLEQVV